MPIKKPSKSVNLPPDALEEAAYDTGEEDEWYGSNLDALPTLDEIVASVHGVEITSTLAGRDVAYHAPYYAKHLLTTHPTHSAPSRNLHALHRHTTNTRNTSQVSPPSKLASISSLALTPPLIAFLKGVKKAVAGMYDVVVVVAPMREGGTDGRDAAMSGVVTGALRRVKGVEDGCKMVRRVKSVGRGQAGGVKAQKRSMKVDPCGIRGKVVVVVDDVVASGAMLDSVCRLCSEAGAEVVYPFAICRATREG
ncbi:hypothetical protein HK104_004585 [Borealophlyctis nickersoniae]|nr:hypothetical protein HK104_004585 [Borealophlyctis nickersoniae]